MRELIIERYIEGVKLAHAQIRRQKANLKIDTYNAVEINKKITETRVYIKQVRAEMRYLINNLK
jgi:hypothetical protein